MPFGGTTPEQDKKIDSCISQISGTNKKTGKSFTNSEKVAVCKSQVMGTKSYFFTNLELKSSDDGDFYIEGIASSINEDLGNDTVTGECLDQMADMINDGNIKLGFDHTEMLGGQLNTEAVGRIFEAKVKEGKLWIKGILDHTFKHFEEIKHKIRNKFLDGLSIEYRVDPEKTITDFKDGNRFRVIGGLKKLLRIALTPTPMNMDALFDYQIKHLADEEKSVHGSAEHTEPDKNKKKKKKGDKKMSDENKDSKEGKEEETKAGDDEGKKDAGAEASKKDEAKGDEAAKEDEDKSEDKEEGKSVDFEKLGKETYEKQVTDKKNAELKSMYAGMVKDELKALKEPYINPAGKFDTEAKSEFTTELKTWRDTVQDPKMDIEMKYQAAAELHNKLHKYGITRRVLENNEFKNAGRTFQIRGNGMQDIEIKGFEYKAQLEHDTNKVSDTDYFQNAAELNDVYDPVIISHLNDKTTLWGLMRKKAVANIGSDRYGFKFWSGRIAGIGGDSSTYNYDEGATLTGQSGTMTKAQIPFMQYGAVVQVSGLTVAETRGAVGDIFAKTLQRATADLLRGINADLFGTAVGFTDGGKILGLQVIGDDGGTYATLYGHARSTFTTLQGTDDAQSNTPNIDKVLLRTMVRVPEKNGANRSQMIYVCDQIQRDKILGLLDPAQRFNSTSARAGFEGMPTFDGIPIHADDQCDDGFIYAIPMDAYFAAVLVAPTFEELAKTDDSKKGFVKTYFAVVCENPNWVYKVTGLNTA